MPSANEMMQRGATRLYASLVARGYSPGEIEERFHQQYYPSELQSIRSAINYARQALRAGEVMEGLDANTPIRAGQVPRPSGAGLQYRYNVYVRWLDPDSNSMRSTVLTFVRAGPESRADIEGYVLGQFQTAMQGRSRLFGSKEVRPGSTLDRTRIIGIERA